MTPDRFANYMSTKTSSSMMDHYFDKLLQIAVFDKQTVANDWLCEEADRRVDPLVQVCLKYGKTGKAPISMIKKFAKELESPVDDEKKSVEVKIDSESPILAKRKREDTTAVVPEKRRKTVSQETQTYEVNKKFGAAAVAPRVDNYYKTSRRGFTTTLVLPSSIVDNAQSMELKTYLVSQIAKAAATFCFSEIVIVSCDKHSRMQEIKQDVTTTEFFVANLEYLETPQYLRKALFPKSPALRFAGLMNPIDTPHHVRATEWLPYREGVVINRPSKDAKGSWANIGIYKDCQLDLCLQEGTRVTVKLD